YHPRPRRWCSMVWLSFIAVAVACTQNASALDLPPFREAHDPIVLDKPIVITTSGIVRLKRDYLAKRGAFVIAAPDVTIQGNSHVVIFNTDGAEDVIGVHLYVNGDWAPTDKRLGKLPNGSRAVNASIDNLVLRQGNPHAARNVGIGGFSAQNVHVTH